MQSSFSDGVLLLLSIRDLVPVLISKNDLVLLGRFRSHRLFSSAG
jgi:hypothetical protein